MIPFPSVDGYKKKEIFARFIRFRIYFFMSFSEIC